MAAKIVGSAQPEADIAVLALDRLLVAPTPLVLESRGVAVSERLFFLGFPFGLSTYAGGENAGYPVPLVKGAIVAGFLRAEHPGTIGFLLDAINNRGFSGGPVISSGSPPRVVAVISGYLSAPSTALDSSGHSIGVVQENTGIVQSYAIDFATRIINANPIGFRP